MNRRTFLKLAGITPFLYSCIEDKLVDIPVSVHSNANIGHLIRNKDFTQVKHIRLDDGLSAVIGAGVAGLSAAKVLNAKVFELGDVVGGTAASVEFAGLKHHFGAHYELGYPAGYDEEALSFLEDQKLISWQEDLGLYNFIDSAYLIDKRNSGRAMVNGVWKETPFIEDEWYHKFEKLMDSHYGLFDLPLSDEVIERYSMSMEHYLRDTIGLPDHHKIVVDYHMKDDYGAGSEIVSAAAGIAYYACRPYYRQDIPLFSPPEGNAFLCDRLSRGLDIALKRIVFNISSVDNRYLVSAYNIREDRVEEQMFDKVIWAGKMHVLPFVMPEMKLNFERVRHAPWLSVLMELEEFHEDPHWQIEMPGIDSEFMGFVDSGAQYQTEGKRVITAYYCLEENAREDLLQDRVEDFFKRTVEYFDKAFGSDNKQKIKSAMIVPIGHGMAIPDVKFLGIDFNNEISQKNFAVAGTDNGRLPLFFEAVSSGIKAAKIVTDEN